MEARNISDRIKGIVELIPRHDIEKFVFKTLLLTWGLIIIVLIVLKAVIGQRDYVKRRVMEAAKGAEKVPIEQADIIGYESAFDSVKYPEAVEDYSKKISRDPFSERRPDPEPIEVIRADRDFVLMSIEKIPLPLIYRGYIELPDRIIGQVNWHKSTRFVNRGSVLNDYTIESISKDVMLATYRDGREIEFKLNTPVLTDRLQAVLYDNISKESYNVQVSTRIGEYEVVEISRDHVVIRMDGKETVLEKK